MSVNHHQIDRSTHSKFGESTGIFCLLISTNYIYFKFGIIQTYTISYRTEEFKQFVVYRNAKDHNTNTYSDQQQSKIRK